jgi:hypothetical protein
MTYCKIFSLIKDKMPDKKNFQLQLHKKHTPKPAIQEFENESDVPDGPLSQSLIVALDNLADVEFVQDVTFEEVLCR